MNSLEQTLLDRTALSTEDLARAESRRSEMGGRLETALLELGLITESELAPALANHYGLPAATAKDLENIPESVQALLSREQAGTYGSVPFAAAPGRVDIAVSGALDLEQADELAFLLGRRVRFYVLNEVRMAQALQRQYEQPQSPRLLNLADRVARGLGPSQDLANEPAMPAALSPVVPTIERRSGTGGEFGGVERRSSSTLSTGARRLTPTKPREERRTVALSEEERTAIFGATPEPESAPPENIREPASDLARLSNSLQAATSPTGVGEAFLAFLGSFFDTVLLLRPEGELFRGWLARDSTIARDQLRQLTTGPGLARDWLELVNESQPVLTQLGPPAAAIGLDNALDVEIESPFWLIPVHVQERVVCLAASGPGRPLERNEEELLANARLRTGLALQSWILRRKTPPDIPSQGSIS